MEPEIDDSLPLVDGRFLALDEQGTGLRATWRPAHGFVNLTLWRGDRCVESFHLSPSETSNLVSFLVASLASTAPKPTLSLVSSDENLEPEASDTPNEPLAPRLANVRGRVSAGWRAFARRLHRHR